MTEKAFWRIMTFMLILALGTCTLIAFGEVSRGNIVSAFLIALVGGGLAACIDVMFKHRPA